MNPRTALTDEELVGLARAVALVVAMTTRSGGAAQQEFQHLCRSLPPAAELRALIDGSHRWLPRPTGAGP